MADTSEPLSYVDGGEDEFAMAVSKALKKSAKADTGRALLEEIRKSLHELNKDDPQNNADTDESKG